MPMSANALPLSTSACHDATSLGMPGPREASKEVAEVVYRHLVALGGRYARPSRCSSFTASFLHIRSTTSAESGGLSIS